MQEEKIELIKRLCEIQLNQDRLFNEIFCERDYKTRDEENRSKKISKIIEYENLHDLFYVDLTEIIFDLLGLPEENSDMIHDCVDNDIPLPDDYFTREYWDDIWRSHCDEVETGVEDSVIIDSFINIMEREVDNINIERYFPEINKGGKISHN